MRSEGAGCCVLSSPFIVCLDWIAAQSVGCRCYCRLRFASLLCLCLYRNFRAHSFVLVKETSTLLQNASYYIEVLVQKLIVHYI